MEEIKIHVEAEVNATESEDKVKKTIEKVFGNMSMQVQPLRKGSLVVAESTDKENLFKLYNILRRERIRAAARKVMLEGFEKRTITFFLNKQVAFAGQVSFSNEIAESPLGPIKVRIESNNPRELIDWLTRTE